MTDPFVHLHNHTSYSLLDGAAKVDDLVKQAASDGAPGIGITDHGNLYGLIDFYKTCKKYEVNPVLGIEAYFADDRTDKTPRKKDDTSDLDGSDKRYYHLTVLAYDNSGYQNLLKLSTDAFLNGFYYKPRTDWSALEQYKDGLIVTTGCLGGPVLQELLYDHFDAALEKTARLQDIFGKDNVYVELQNHGIIEQVKTNPQLIEIAKRLDAPLLATNDCHYTHHEDNVAHDALLCVQTAAKISDEKRFRFQSDQHYLKTAAEMRYLFRDVEDSCDNSLIICERSNVNIDFDTLHLPVYAVPEGFENPTEYLAHLSFAGLTERYGTPTEEAKARLTYELQTIASLGLDSYFLIVWDLVKFADSQGIRRGAARGSVAGSLVAFCLDISKVDPLRHKLLFERFLNPHRIAMPDIDLDFDSRYRESLINYTIQKYGTDRVAQVVTFSIIRARAAIRDAARVLDYPIDVSNKISKAMPEVIMGEVTPIDACLEYDERYEMGYNNAEEFRALYDSDPNVRKIVDVARGLEGLVRQDSVHAAAVVIADRPLVEYVPLQVKKNGPVITQFEKNTVEDLGLLKMDYLGLRNLDVMSECIRFIGYDPGVEKTTFDDANTFSLLQRGDTIGVFQLESMAMRSLLMRLMPTSIDDIAAVVALYRPGPMAENMHNDYADRKNGRQPVRYFHEDAKEILGHTYGLCCFQEQVMQIAQRFAGYSMAEADGLRKVMGKKLVDKMALEKDKFIQGCIDNSYGDEFGADLFKMIEGFARYGFNASHAYGYAYIAYQTAFLKANFTKEYMAALCGSVADNIDKCAVFLQNARDHGIEVKPPNINSSESSFAVDDKGILVGLNAIKGLGPAATKRILKERSNGPFNSLIDFVQRVNPNSGGMVALADCGALDAFGTRQGISAVTSDILEGSRKVTKREIKGQDALFNSDEMWDVFVPETEYSNAELLDKEKSIIGIYISGHPLDGLEQYFTDIRMADLHEMPEQRVKVFCQIAEVRKKRTKMGQSMAIMSVEDQTGHIDVVVFPKMFARYPGLEAGQIGLMELNIGTNNFDERNFILNSFAQLSQEEQHIETYEDFRIFLPHGFAHNSEYISKLKGLLLTHHGNQPVSLYVSRSSQLKLSNEFEVAMSEKFLADLKDLFKQYARR